MYSDFSHKHDCIIFIKIRHGIRIQFNGNHMKMKKKSIIMVRLTFQEIPHKKLVVFSGAF